ncbi:MAG: hypothetical protein JXR10_15210 [Cyclobacteriaceae bacterium]
MINPSIVYLWGFKPQEASSPPKETIYNNRNYIDKYVIIDPHIALDLVKDFGLYDLYQMIPDQAWVVKTDLVRILYVYYYGQIYLDLDCKIRKNFVDDFREHEVLLFKESFLWNTRMLGEREMKIRLRVSNYAFASKVIQHPFFKIALDEASKRLHQLLVVEKKTNFSQKDILWVCGPDVFSTIYHLRKNDFPTVRLLPKNHIKHMRHGAWRN